MGSRAKISVLGTGLMGYPMSQNLLKAGFEVTAWNRSPDKAERLRIDGAMIASTAQEAVTDANIVISMVSDGSITLSLIEECKSHLNANAIWIDMSSTKPKEAQAAAKALAPIAFIDAPVSGGTKGAEAATLAIMAGGDAADFDRVNDALEAMGRPVLVGGTGAGQLAKLANQLIVGATIGAVAEAMLLLERGGADPAAVRQALKGGFADGTILQQHGARMTTRDFVPGGLSKLQVKDLNNVLEEARSLSLTMPVTEMTRDRFQRYIDELGGAEKDHSGLFEELLDQNGLLS